MNKFMQISLHKVLQYLIFFLFPIQVIISTISNYSTESFLLKGVTSFILLVAIYFFVNQNRIDIRTMFSNTLLIILLLIVIIPLISLAYSQNPGFGFLKIINLMIGLIPAILGLNIIIKYYKKDIFENVVLIFSVICALSVVIISLFDLFDQSKIYSFSFTRWSHIIYGRFISSFGLLLLLVFIQNKKKIYFLFYLICLQGTIVSGFRAGTIGLILFSLSILISNVTDKNRLYLIITILFLLISFIFLIPTKLSERYSTLINLFFIDDYIDISLNSRFIMWEIGLKMFLQNPLIGVGFGGFKQQFVNDTVGIPVNYPHNIIIEAAAELGIIGLILIGFILFIIFKNSLKINKIFIWYFLFALQLSLSSKDITTNTMLFCGIGLVMSDR